MQNTHSESDVRSEPLAPVGQYHRPALVTCTLLDLKDFPGLEPPCPVAVKLKLGGSKVALSATYSTPGTDFVPQVRHRDVVMA